MEVKNRVVEAEKPPDSFRLLASGFQLLAS
jgi:hypothetical protein